MPGLGEELRAAREARGLSPSEVSERIHIRSVYLESIEAEDWSAIGAPVYVRGFIRTYARFLGVDTEHAVAYFNASVTNDETPPVSLHHPISVGVRSRRGPSAWLWGATLVAAILVGFVGYEAAGLRSMPPHRPGATVVGVAAPGAVSQAAAPPGGVGRRIVPAPAPVGTPALGQLVSHRLGIHVSQRSWLLVRVDGTNRLEGIFPAGTQKWFQGAQADVRAGNAGGVELTVNGRSLGVMGKPGDVVERTLPLARQR